MSQTKHIHCDECGTLTVTKFSNLDIPRLGKKYQVSVNAEVCPNCQEIYLPGKFAQDFERQLKIQPVAA